MFAGLAVPSQAGSASSAYLVRVFRFVDDSRSIRLPDRRLEPRALVTVVRYPTSPGAHPLVVFAHGFAVTPAVYGRLLDAWAEAGYVVAAPAFPLTRAGAPGGPDESDIVNQPQDMSFVIGRLLALGARTTGVLAGRIDAAHVAVAGHSDGGVTALAVAFDHRLRDPRVSAAIVLSGAAFAWMGRLDSHGPPLLALQGTADTVNPPSATSDYFNRLRRPKFLIWLLGASHRPPYTGHEPQFAVVERTTTAFLDHYLEGRPLRAFIEAARRPRISRLVADP